MARMTGMSCVTNEMLEAHPTMGGLVALQTKVSLARSKYYGYERNRC